MGWILPLVETGIYGQVRVIDVMDIRPLGDLGDIAKPGADNRAPVGGDITVESKPCLLYTSRCV